MTYNECYPERKIFQTEAKDTWIFGLYNTCSYNTPRGKQVFGTCCTRMYPQVPKRTSGNINFTPRKYDARNFKPWPITKWDRQSLYIDSPKSMLLLKKPNLYPIGQCRDDWFRD